jgi:hypothetical protein
MHEYDIKASVHTNIHVNYKYCESSSLCYISTLQRRFDLCVPRNETAQKLRTRQRSFISGNICFEFSVQGLSSVAHIFDNKAALESVIGGMV